MNRRYSDDEVHRVVREPYEALRAAVAREPNPDWATRTERLLAVEGWLKAHQGDIAAAIDADFGGRSSVETRLAEVAVCLQGSHYLRRHLRGWMRPEGRATPLPLLPGASRLVRQPKGLVGIVSPWNYPVQLAIAPLTVALAAGNRVLLKPSEYTPRSSELLARCVDEALGDDVARVVLGGPEVGAAFSSLPLDHLLFTGSTSVGRHVMRAAAEHLTPVTLELGGKSPAIVHDRFDLRTAAERIAYGKLLNAGQTCIAPDYVLVGAGRAETFVGALKAAVSAMYPTIAGNPDYTAIANDRHRARLQAHLDDAVAKGARAIPLVDAPAPEGDDRRMVPTALLGTDDTMTVMQDEIFGPLLPVHEVADLDEALAAVAARPRPLAMYYFDHDAERIDRVLTTSWAGGVTLNDCLLHIAVDDLPFGGTGDSGMGAYHGFEGFRTFSHEKAVFHQSRVSGGRFLRPPYGPMVERILAWLTG